MALFLLEEFHGRGAWRLQSMGLQRVGHNWVSNKHFAFKMSQVLCYVLKSCLNCVWLFETLWTVTHQVSLCTGSSRQEYWSGFSCPSRGDLPNPGIKHWPFLHWQAESLPLVPSRISSVQFSHSVMSDFWHPHASLSTTNSQSLLKLMSIDLVMPSNHLILCLPLLPPPSIFPSTRFFSNESVLHIR